MPIGFDRSEPLGGIFNIELLVVLMISILLATLLLATNVPRQWKKNPPADLSNSSSLLSFCYSGAAKDEHGDSADIHGSTKLKSDSCHASIKSHLLFGACAVCHRCRVGQSDPSNLGRNISQSLPTKGHRPTIRLFGHTLPTYCNFCIP